MAPYDPEAAARTDEGHAATLPIITLVFADLHCVEDVTALVAG